MTNENAMFYRQFAKSHYNKTAIKLSLQFHPLGRAMMDECRVLKTVKTFSDQIERKLKLPSFSRMTKCSLV